MSRRFLSASAAIAATGNTEVLARRAGALLPVDAEQQWTSSAQHPVPDFETCGTARGTPRPEEGNLGLLSTSGRP